MAFRAQDDILLTALYVIACRRPSMLARISRRACHTCLVSDQLDEFYFFSWEADHFDVKDNGGIAGDTGSSRRRRAPFLAKGETSLCQRLKKKSQK